MNFTRKDDKGNEIKPMNITTNAHADEGACTHNDKDMPTNVCTGVLDVKDALMCIKENEAPDMPIANMKIESFLCNIAENSLHGMPALIEAYKRCGFNVDKPSALVRNDIRHLLFNKRIKERLAYLKECEWEINKPDLSSICKEFEDILNDEELAMNSRITALNSLAKLAGLLENNQHKSDTKVAVIFNTSEKPPIDVKVEQVN
jgi:hypothetical protein